MDKPFDLKKIQNYLIEKINVFNMYLICGQTRVSVQGVKSFGSHFAYLCRGFEFYEVK